MKGLAPLFLGIFGTFAFSWVGLTMIPNWQIGHLDPQMEEDGTDVYPQPQSGMVERGARVYAANGCIYCHSQQVRADYASDDIERKWGDRRSAPRDYIFERPTFLGKMRMGQDLSNIGARAPAEQENVPPAGAVSPAASPAPQGGAAAAPLPPNAAPAKAGSPPPGGPAPKATTSPPPAGSPAASPAPSAASPPAAAGSPAAPSASPAPSASAAPSPKPPPASPSPSAVAKASPAASPSLPAGSPATSPGASPSSPPPKAPAGPAPKAPLASPSPSAIANASPGGTTSGLPGTPAAGARPVRTTGEPPIYSAAWQHVHLYSPRSINVDSNMPAYRFLYQARRISDVPSDEALKFTGSEAPSEGWEIVPTFDAKCLVAYLMSLNQSHPLKGIQSAAPPASPSPAPGK